MPSPITNTLLRFACGALIFSHAVAGELPDLGETARATLSEAREANLGREVMRQIRTDKDYLHDAEVDDYLNALGTRLAAANPDPSHHLSFFAVRDPSINAFALPGGYIGVHTGLIAAVRNESELAGVLAHEIAHVSQNHIARIVDSQKSNALTTLAALAVAILAARSDQGQVSQAAMATAQAMALQNQLDFTRDHEREADRVGLQTMVGAGFSGAGMASFFERLQAQTRVNESHAPAYLRTHPLTYERIADMQSRTAASLAPPVIDSIEFKLVRAKVRADQGDAAEALRRHQAEAAAEPEAADALYALADSALRAGNRRLALVSLDNLEKRYASPMIASLGARIYLDACDTDVALARLRGAMQRYGTTRPLAVAYAAALMRARNAAEARQQVTSYLRVWPGDADLLELLARANFGLDRRAEGYLAQAEALSQQELLAPAIEQLELARKAGDGDYYTLSIVDARLHDWRDRLKQEKSKQATAW
jgi:predicted Zn-dependent protease